MKLQLRRVTLKAINDELLRRGHTARLERGRGYSYIHLGDAASWLDRTVQVPTVSSLTLKQWLDEFERLRKLNQQLMRGGPKRARTAKQ